MDGEDADMVLTDPPYGMGYDVNAYNKSGASNNIYRPIIGDDKCFDPRPLMEYFTKCNEQFWFGFDYYAERIPNKNDGSVIVWCKVNLADQDSGNAFGSHFELIWSKQKHKRIILKLMAMGFLLVARETRTEFTRP